MTRIVFTLGCMALFCTRLSAQPATLTFSHSATTKTPTSAFTSGELIYAHLHFSSTFSGLLGLSDKPVTIVAEYYHKGALLDDEMFSVDAAQVKGSSLSDFTLPVIADPAKDLPLFGKNLFSTRLPDALSKLRPGTYEIECRVKCYSYKNGTDDLARGAFTLTLTGESKAWYQKNAKDAAAAFSQRGITSVIASSRDVAMGAVSGGDVITLINNCGRSVWLRKATGSDKREYRLSPGQDMKYDRNSGYLEEWNFATKKWTTVSRAFTPDASGKAPICK